MGICEITYNGLTRNKIKIGSQYRLHTKTCIVLRIKNLGERGRTAYPHVVYYNKGYDRRKVWVYAIDNFCSEAYELKEQRK